MKNDDERRETSDSSHLFACLVVAVANSLPANFAKVSDVTPLGGDG